MTMSLRSCFLLIAFLLMQAGPVLAGLCRQEGAASWNQQAVCGAKCCCEDDAGAGTSCACAEAPESEPVPAGPVPPPSPGRDLAAAPAVVEVRTDGWLLPSAGIVIEAARNPVRPTAMTSLRPVPLTVRFCAFLI